MIGCVIDGAIGLDQNGELVAVDGQERQKSIEQRVGEDDLVHRFGVRADWSNVTTADQGFRKGLSDLFAQDKGPVHGGLRVVIDVRVPGTDGGGVR